MGHNGGTCPDPRNPVHCMSVVNTNGISDIDFRYCGCRAAATTLEETLQLLEAEWYPGSTTNLTQCITFRSLGFPSHLHG
jgi:hypothetical protein